MGRAVGMKRTLSLVKLFSGLAVSMLCVGATANATTAILSNLNSTASIDTGSLSGMYNWNIDGANPLVTQQFWYRVGTSGGESSINTLTQTGFAYTDVDFDGFNERALVKYTNTVSKFTLQVQTTLQGGSLGSKGSDIAEIITIKNVGTSALDFHFFMYTDFKLSLSSNDKITFLNSTTALQTNVNGAFITTIASASGITSSNEAALFPTLFTSLTNSTPTILSGVLGPLTGDATFGYEWDVSIAVNGTLTVTVDKNAMAIPEPSSMVLALGGFILLGVLGRRSLHRSGHGKHLVTEQNGKDCRQI